MRFIKECWDYDNILLKTYFEIAKTGDKSLLIKGKTPVPKNVLEDFWEALVKKSSKENNNFNFDYYFSTAQSHELLVNEYNLVKACILKLIVRDMRKLEYDKPVVELLRNKGYKIDVSSKLAYLTCLENAQQRSNNLITKIITKQKELTRLGKSEGPPTTFAQALASVSAGMGFEINDGITLSLYNEYKKIIVKKNGRNQQGRPLK